jgi:NAD(P)-dependent dehydrogenase (short-subunit alcohol dehydrogenase family)
VTRCTTLRRYVVRLSVVASSVVLGCAPATRYEAPDALRGYDILVTSQDSLGREIAQALARRGFRVRTHVRGGSRATAYLFAFIFRETDPPALTWLHVRLADTRTGTIVAAVSAPLDSLGSSAAERARAIVDSLAANPALRRGIPPT